MHQLPHLIFHIRYHTHCIVWELWWLICTTAEEFGTCFVSTFFCQVGWSQSVKVMNMRVHACCYQNFESLVRRSEERHLPSSWTGLVLVQWLASCSSICIAHGQQLSICAKIVLCIQIILNTHLKLPMFCRIMQWSSPQVIRLYSSSMSQ